jgi:type II secretory pathway component GspD/PulD (secretin)
VVSRVADDRGPPSAALPDSFEILPEIETGNGAIQGDLEFLNTAEGNLFDVEAFRRQIEAEERPDGIVFNFEDADIKRVVALVIGRILNENYLIDPNVKGTVTLKTEKPLNRDTVFYMLESVLDLYGATISRRKGHYRIYPKDAPGGASVLGLGDIDARDTASYHSNTFPRAKCSRSSRRSPARSARSAPTTRVTCSSSAAPARISAT